MPEKNQPTTVTIREIKGFPITIKAPFGDVTLVGRVEFVHDVLFSEGFYVQGDPQGDRAIVFLVDQESYAVV